VLEVFSYACRRLGVERGFQARIQALASIHFRALRGWLEDLDLLGMQRFAGRLSENAGKISTHFRHARLRYRLLISLQPLDLLVDMHNFCR